jgi:hypothetical protein
MAAKPSATFPKINFVALLAGALSLVSIFLSWWGLDFTLTAFGGFTQSFRWTLWSGPSTISINQATSAQTITTYSPIVGVLVIGSAVLAFLGTIPKASRLLIPSALLSIVAPIIYAVIISQAVSNACNGMGNCINGTFGTMTGTGYSLTWGYQIGFYLAIVTALIGFVAVAFHRTFLTTKSP